MTAKPTRLTKNRHGTYCLRLVVPTRYRGPDGQPREVRVSLRTKEPVRARMGAASLFPHRPINDTRADDPSKHMSRAFAEHLTDIGIKAKGKVFHSFRHTLITRMHVNNVPVGDAELIVGHAAQDLHVRLSASGGRGSGQHGSTHLGTYVQSAAYADANVPLLVRLKIHLDSSPRFPIDITKLAAVARVVQSHLIIKGEGADVVYKSGWHTNKKGYGEQIATQLSL